MRLRFTARIPYQAVLRCSVVAGYMFRMEERIESRTGMSLV